MNKVRGCHAVVGNGNKRLVSIIIPVKNEGINIWNTINSLGHAKTTYPYEIIVVDDASTDGCCNFVRLSQTRNIKLVTTDGLGVAMARNTGVEHACGQYVIFCDAHLFFEDYWIDWLVEPLANGTADASNPGIVSADNFEAIGYGFTWNEKLETKWNQAKEGIFESALLASGCLAIRADTFKNIGGFDRGFRIWGRSDDEISLKLWLFGYRCVVCPNVQIQHIFRKGGEVPYTFSWDDVNYNTIRMAYSHFNYERIEKCKNLIKHSHPEKIVHAVLESDVLEQRERYLKKRIFDDDWFMDKFHINF